MKTVFANPNYEKTAEKIINIVSECCQSSIVEGTVREFPLGGQTWGINYKVDVCEKCGKEADPVEECGVCGEVGCENECE